MNTAKAIIIRSDPRANAIEPETEASTAVVTYRDDQRYSIPATTMWRKLTEVAAKAEKSRRVKAEAEAARTRTREWIEAYMMGIY